MRAVGSLTEALVTELEGLKRKSLGASPTTLSVAEGTQALRSLPWVRARANEMALLAQHQAGAGQVAATADDFVVPAMTSALDLAARQMGEQRGSLVRTLWQLDAQRSRSLEALREYARQSAGQDGHAISASHLRQKIEPGLTTEWANRLLGLQTPEVSGPDADALQFHAMKTEWLRRFEAYYRLWAPISGLTNDLAAALYCIHHKDETRTFQYAEYAFFHLAHYKLSLEWFTQMYGGMWFFPEESTETAVVSAIEDLRIHQPFQESDESWIVQALIDTSSRYQHVPLPMAHSFLSHVKNLQPDLLRTWMTWIGSCECPNGFRRPDDIATWGDDRCVVHLLIRGGEIYQDEIDNMWEQLAGWYTENRSATERGYILDHTMHYDNLWSDRTAPWLAEK